MNFINSTLIDLGLSPKEAAVYLASLKFPNQPTSILAKKTTLNRGTTFVILHELLKKGLVKKYLVSNIQRFSAVNPEELLTWLEKKEFNLKQQKTKITELLPDLKNLQGVESKKPIFQFYEGRDGIQNLLSEMLRGDHQNIKSIIDSQALIMTIGDDFFDELEKKRTRKKYTLSLLLPYSQSRDQTLKTNAADYRQTRYLPEPLNFPMSSFLFGSTALLISHQDNFGLSIDSEQYLNMQATFFDTLWAISKSEVTDKDFRMPLI